MATRNRVERDLIFDIGLHNGDDAAYYLHLGYRVVGIEASPPLAAECAKRFEQETRQQRITIINAGVLGEAGVFTFYRNLLDNGWSSFEREKGKKGGEWEELRIPCVAASQLIAQYGTPFFMKIDVEGADLQVLRSLIPEIAPSYISVELNCVDPIVERLIELDYSAFKFVDGETFWSTPPIFDHQIGWRLLRKAGRVAPFIRSAMGKLPQWCCAKSEWNPPGKYNPEHYPFTSYSSGPFGEQAAGSWMTREAALRWFEKLKRDYRRAGQEGLLWWDVHARHRSAEY